MALRELGRIERTLFMLEWLQSVELRRRVHAGLNKGEETRLPEPFSSIVLGKSATVASSNSGIAPVA